MKGRLTLVLFFALFASVRRWTVPGLATAFFVGTRVSPSFVASTRRHDAATKLLSGGSPIADNTNASIAIANATETATTRTPLIAAVVAPLRYKGPYPILSLRFPQLQNGRTLSFCLDTGANVNSVDRKIVQGLSLPVAMSSRDVPGAAGMGGVFQASDIYILGDCQLDGMPPEQRNFIFMRNITAASLPSPGAMCDGLLSLQFMHSFKAGVEFDWHGTDGDPPTIIFYTGQDLPDHARPGLVRVPLEKLSTEILSLSVRVNGTLLSAILDTGSPVTILSQQAARVAGIVAFRLEQGASRDTLSTRMHSQQVGDGALVVGGMDGGIVQLQRSVSPVSIQAVSNNSNVSLGQGPVYVGDLPGMAFLDGFEAQEDRAGTLPAIILGMDFLRQTYRMVLRSTEREVWFEELRDQLTSKKSA